jgi:hypothetical protein
MSMRWRVMVFLILAAVATPCRAQNWELPADRTAVSRAQIETIVAGNDYPETSSYTRRTEFIDFNSFGKKFTQVVIRLDPKTPRMRNGKKLVVVGAEPGSEYGMDFLETVEGKEGMGVWLAKRGVTFIAPTRVGRWNFLDPNGSWKNIPIGQRMPIFNRDQKSPWPATDYTVETNSNAATAGASNVNRYAKPGTELYNQMLAGNPITMLKGYALALNTIIPAAERRNSVVLYWGMSTGGAFLYPLSKYVTPDGYLGWGTSSTGIAYFYRSVKEGNYSLPYDRSAVRVRERGLPDFDLYTRTVPQNVKDAWWQNALKNPRFKSAEDAAMMFGTAALAETAARLWMTDFLPDQDRKVGFAKFVSSFVEPSLPPAELKQTAILDMNGTLDEVLPPGVVDAQRELMEPHAAKYRVARVEGFHHYLFTQPSIKVVGSLWLRFIDSGYFDRTAQ